MSAIAFLAPELVRAAVEGRLARGINIERLRDARAEWSKQFEALGLNPQALRISEAMAPHQAYPGQLSRRRCPGDAFP